jgi:hypothetical protein
MQAHDVDLLSSRSEANAASEKPVEKRVDAHELTAAVNHLSMPQIINSV